MPSKQTPPRSTNSSAPKPSKKEEKQEKQEYRGPMLTLKLTSSVACKFYVDGEYKGIINPDQIIKIELKKGDYQFRAVNNENDLDVWQDLYNVAEVNTEKLFDVGVYLKEKIDQRVREEEAAALAKKLAEQAEINRLRKEEQDAKDKVEREKQYKEYLAKANEYYLDKSYANALENYQKALFLNPNSDEAKIGLENVRYYNTLIADTEEDYASFIENYPASKYLPEIKSKLENRKEENSYKRAQKSNQMDDYESYISKYPNGKYATDVKTIIENSYFQWGQNSFNAGNFRDAQSQLQTYINRYPYGTHSIQARDLKTKVDRKVRALNRDDYAFFDYAFTKKAFIGISFGTYNQRKAGYYFTTRFNTDLFTSNLYNTNNVDESYIPVRSELRQGKLDAVLGITYGVFNPFWLYTGIGCGWYPTFSNYDFFGDNRWVRNSANISNTPIFTSNGNIDTINESNRTKAPILQEFGLAVAFKPFNFSAGVCLIGYKEVSMMFSAGFTFSR
jgi:outer membrane protein assembly factor BamD (BamD/ComL family)